MTTRRILLATTAAAFLGTPLLASANISVKPRSKTAVELPKLPYGFADLEPHISAKTVELHYGTHHAGYVKRLAAALEATGQLDLSLEEVIALTHGKPELQGMANNAGQAYNHAMYWASLTPKKGTAPNTKLQAAIDRDFGSVAKLKEALQAEANKHFGSGWAWLAASEAGKLTIIGTHDAGTPQSQGMHGLLVVDVWEHAYYIDRQAKRAAYTAALVDNLLNWDFANANYAVI